MLPLQAKVAAVRKYADKAGPIGRSGQELFLFLQQPGAIKTHRKRTAKRIETCAQRHLEPLRTARSDIVRACIEQRDNTGSPLYPVGEIGDIIQQLTDSQRADCVINCNRPEIERCTDPRCWLQHKADRILIRRFRTQVQVAARQ